MGFSENEGYTPSTIQDIIELLIVGINEQFGTEYTYETFLGTNFYKYFYVIAQRIQAHEIKLSEVFLKLQQFITITNEKIMEPKTTNNGLIAFFDALGYKISIDPPTEVTRGELSICVEVDEDADDYATQKLLICNAIKDSAVAGVVSMGDESEEITLTNGQAFDFKFSLPTRSNVSLKITITTSKNNQHLVDSPEVIKEKLLENISERYRIGKDFEPEIYFTFQDAPYAGDIKLEYNLGAGLKTEIHSSSFDDLFEFEAEAIDVIQE